MKRVIVAGGGIIGLTSAYYLAEAGHEVTIIDKHDFFTNCSTGNAGLIVPSHFNPLASPGIVWQGIKWILNPSSPFSMNFKPDIDLIKWGLKFWASCSASHVSTSAPVLLNFNLLSKELYRDLANTLPQIQLRENGLLMLCLSEKKLEEEYKVAEMAIKLGLDIEKLEKTELEKMKLGSTISAAGGVLYKNDAHISPLDLTIGLKEMLKKKNVRIAAHSELIDFIEADGRIAGIITNNGKMECDELVIATGVLSQPVFKRLNIRANIQAGKGYSFDHTGSSPINIPAILVDARVAVTPYDNYTRYAGAMEIGGEQGFIKVKKIEGMVNSIRKFFPDINLTMPETQKIWAGLRPCSTDGLPYIGRAGKYGNVIIAAGHSMMGVSLAPATAKVVEELVSDKKLSFNIAPFSPDRN